MAKAVFKKVNLKSPLIQKEGKRMDRMPKASGRADFDATGQLLIAGAPGLKVIAGPGFGGGVKKSSIRLSKSKPKPIPSGFEVGEIEQKGRMAKVVKSPKKLVGSKIRKSIIKKK